MLNIWININACLIVSHNKSNMFSPSIIPVMIGTKKDKPKKATKVPVKLRMRLKRIES